MTKQDFRDQFNTSGRVWFRQALTDEELKALRVLASHDGRPGERITPCSPLFRAVKNLGVTQDIQEIWPDMQPVRLLSFDKSEAVNWSVPWHQDRVIEVSDRASVGGYENWSQKAGVWHCEPPLEKLETMLFVRVHLDRNSDDNGAMEIALGSHQEGKVSSHRASEIAEAYPTEITTAEAGDVLVLAMLTLHRSRSSANANTSNTRRRALRVDYAPFDLPDGLNWAS